jgi:Xaa-Pro aminopeptidase
MRVVQALSALVAALVAAAPAAAQNRGGALDLEAAQALIAVQALDGWLLYQNRGANPVAEELVGPGPTGQPWFFFIPADGTPRALVHHGDRSAFVDVPGDKVTYGSAGDMRIGLRKILAGAKTVAMEHSPGSKIPSLDRVDAVGLRAVKSAKVEIRSSAQLVQLTKAMWKSQGRVAHYVAAHHLGKLLEEAMAMIAAKIAAGEMVTEYDVQQAILAGYKVRGLAGEPPVVAAGDNSANLRYVPAASSAAVIEKGDLIRFELAARLDDSPRPIWASIAWTAYVGAEVPERYQQLFTAVAAGQGAAIALIRERLSAGRPIRGHEVDAAARQAIAAAGHGERFAHATGHGLDTSLRGDGANLEGGDQRNLVAGSGFTISPGIYLPGELGVRTGVGVYIGAGGLEVTSRRQQQITAITAP